MDHTDADKRGARERGSLFLSQEKLAVWQRVYSIAHDGRNDAEARDLMADATRMALEQHLAKKGEA